MIRQSFLDNGKLDAELCYNLQGHPGLHDSFDPYHSCLQEENQSHSQNAKPATFYGGPLAETQSQTLKHDISKQQNLQESSLGASSSGQVPHSPERFSSCAVFAEASRLSSKLVDFRPVVQDAGPVSFSSMSPAYECGAVVAGGGGRSSDQASIRQQVHVSFSSPCQYSPQCAPQNFSQQIPVFCTRDTSPTFRVISSPTNTTVDFDNEDNVSPQYQTLPPVQSTQCQQYYNADTNQSLSSTFGMETISPYTENYVEMFGSFYPGSKLSPSLAYPLYGRTAVTYGYRSAPKIYLSNYDLWRKFHHHTTEMIITKQGR